jgi:hypothetical protein
VSEAHFPGVGNRAAAYKARVRHGVMGRSERARPEQPTVRGQSPRYAPDRRGLQGLVEGQNGEDARQPPSEHGLAASGGPQHQDVVPPRGSDLQRALGVRLTPDLGEIAA